MYYNAVSMSQLSEIISGSRLVPSASYAVTASYALTSDASGSSVSASYAESSSYAVTASYFSGSGGGGALSTLTDVNVAGVADGQVLSYNAGTGKWIPIAMAAVTTLLYAFPSGIINVITFNSSATGITVI